MQDILIIKSVQAELVIKFMGSNLFSPSGSLNYSLKPFIDFLCSLPQSGQGTDHRKTQT